MGRSRMNCMKITLHLLALCLLLSITTKVSGKPNPRHLLIETKNKAENNDDYQQSSFGNNFGNNARFNQIDASGGGNVATGGSSINTGNNHFGGGWGCRCGRDYEETGADYRQSLGNNRFGHNAVVNQINANGGGNVATGGSSINTGGNHFGGCWLASSIDILNVTTYFCSFCIFNICYDYDYDCD